MTLVQQLQGSQAQIIGGDGITKCCVCGAPLDADGINCTRINGPAHGDSQSNYYGTEQKREE